MIYTAKGLQKREKSIAGHVTKRQILDNSFRIQRTVIYAYAASDALDSSLKP